MATPTATLYYKATLAGAWVESTAVEVQRVTFTMAPGYGSCQFRVRYGRILETGLTGAGLATVSALDFRGQYIKVVLTAQDDTTHTWYGYCPTAEDRPQVTAGGLATGDQTFTAYTMDYFLRHATARYAYADRSGVAVQIGRFPDFNHAGRTRNSRYKGNRAAAEFTAETGNGIYGFTDGDSPSAWTALDAVRHLLYVITQDLGLTFTLAGQYAYLANIVDPWTGLDGMTYWEILTRLIPRSRGFAFDVTGTVLTVVSISDAAIGTQIPANPNIVVANLDTIPYMERPTVNHLENAHYDTILVRGERMRVCFTLSYDSDTPANSTLAADWTSAEETAYAAADDEDRIKSANRHVYCRFVPAAGFETVGSAVRVPSINTATGQPDWTTAKTVHRDGLLLDRTLPLEDASTDQPRPPLVVVETSAGEYVDVANPQAEDAEGASVQMLDDRPGFLLRARFPHLFALNHFSETSEWEALYDWQTIRATVSMAVDDRVAVQVSAISAEAGEVSRTKVIDVPDAHLWVIGAGTITDAALDALTAEAADRTIRDDSARLVTIAQMARVWYGRPRAAISVQYREIASAFDRLGHVISAASYSGTAVPAGTVVTHIAYDFDQLTVEFRTEWSDLDFRGLVPRQATPPARQEERMQRIEQELSNTPVLYAGGRSGRSGSLVKITGLHPDSPGAGSQRMFQGDVYADGSGAAATKTGVTIRVSSLAADVTDYPTTFLTGVPLSVTWTGASATVYSETVYEVQPFVWWESS